MSTNQSINDDYDCIGGEGWFYERCSENFLVNVPRRLFSDTPPLAAPFRDGCSIRLANEQKLRLPENERKEYFESIKNFMLRASSGIVRQKNDTKYELSCFQELSMLVHVSTPYEEVFVRRNACLKFLQRVLRSAQLHRASLKPAYPGSITCCTCGNIPHYEYCPLHDIYDNEKEFLYPLLEPGDRVIRGPDWQWGTQGNGGEGVVVLRKEWKGVKDQGIRVRWDNDDENVYRYGAEYCYDVIELNPMQKASYVPLGGFEDCSETFWSRYVTHFIVPTKLGDKSRSLCGLTVERLVGLVPDYESDNAMNETFAGQSLYTLEVLLQVLEKELMTYLSGHRVTAFVPSRTYSKILHDVLFPFQLYLLSQAEGDSACQHTESVILEGYLMQLLSLCVRIISKAMACVSERIVEQSLVITSLHESALSELLSYMLTLLYMGEYSHHIATSLRLDLEDLTMLWCNFLHLCDVHNALQQNKEDLLTSTIYTPNFVTIPVALPWYLTLINLLVTTNTRYHYSCIHFNYVETREDVRCLLESYIFSGGLIEDSKDITYQHRFLLSVFENEMNENEVLHRWIDKQFPEPAWKRKRQPVMVNMEVKLLVVLARLCGYQEDMMRCCQLLTESGDIQIAVPETLCRLWRYVIIVRELLRQKKQEYISHTVSGMNKALSQTSITRISSTRLKRSDSTQFRSEQRRQELNLRSMPSERRVHLRQMISFAGEVKSENDRVDVVEVKSEIALDHTDINPSQHSYLRNDSAAEISRMGDADESELMMSSNFEDYVDQLLQKLELMMQLRLPWDVNEDETETESDEVLQAREKIIMQLSKSSSGLSEEKGFVPATREELIYHCVYKFLFVSTTVTCKHLHESLRRRTENAYNKQRIFEEGLQFLRQITDFPQASRLFLLGLFHEMTVFSKLCIGGYHEGKRQRERSFAIDYLGNCEGASVVALKSVIASLLAFTQYLKKLMSVCVDTLQWRLGSAIMWFISTIASPKMPYFAMKLDLLRFIQEETTRLGKWYEMRNDYSKDILISPGAFWDSLANKPISIKSSHFHKMLRDMQENGAYVNMQTTEIPGVFPIGIMTLANTMRLAYSITLIQLFSDYNSRSRQSPAHSTDTLYNWTLTDVSNLFVRQSSKYLDRARTMFDEFMGYFGHMQRVLRDRCESWQPFAPISYHNNESTGNPYTCIKIVDPKNIMRGMIATDMLISAAEAIISSYLAVMLFIVKTRTAMVIPWQRYGNMIWDMLYFSPRHQKLATMIMQYVIPTTDYIPPVFESQPHHFVEVVDGIPDTDSILKNPLLFPPVFPQDQPTTVAKRQAFVIYLLHLASHSDGCPGALVGERTSCPMCCNFFPFIYNTMCRGGGGFAMPNKTAFVEEILMTHEKVFVSSCKMGIRPDGHSASFCSLVFAEEVVYLLREMMKQPEWNAVMMDVFEDIFSITVQQIREEEGPKDRKINNASGFHVILRRRTPWFCMSTAVLKVLGAITPRMYAGSRIRIHELMMEGENDVSSLIHAAYQSHGTGSIIKYNRSMGEALVLLDKIDTPRLINSYVFDVVDRVEPPCDSSGKYKVFLDAIQEILQLLEINSDLFTVPTDEMPFFNTSDLQLSPSELQNVIMHLYCVRCINHMVISNESLACDVMPQTMQKLIRIAVQPVPCTISFNTLIVRQYFNWFIEYLIDTYAGAARLLPMELQKEEDGEVVYGRDKVDPRFGFGKEEEEEVQMEVDEKRPPILRNEKRMKVAQTLSEISCVDVGIVYAVLQSVDDNESDALTFLTEQPHDILKDIYGPLHISYPAKDMCDESVLTDMELGIRRLQLSSATVSNVVTDDLLSQVIPPFTRLQRLTAANMENMNSIYGVIASVSDKSLLYSPIPETGVITAVNASGVTLSHLNENSGILEEETYTPTLVALHKHRLLYYLSNVKLLRGVTGRICCVLFMKYIRELWICLLYYVQKHDRDVLILWDVQPQDMVRLTQYTYVSYMNSTVLSPSKHNHVTLVSCLFRILKGCVKTMARESQRGTELLQAFMEGAWDDNETSKRMKMQMLSSCDWNEVSEAHTTTPATAGKECYSITSLHPVFAKCKYYDKVIVPGVAGLRVVFDSRCHLDADNASLTFFRDDNNSEIIARFTGDSSNFCAFTLRGNTLRFLFESNAKATSEWGYAFVIQPFENVQWSGDVSVLRGPCFDWAGFALQLVIDITHHRPMPDSQFYGRVLRNLIGYLRTSGMPFKSKIVELLIKVQSSGEVALSDQPDLTGMYDAVIQFCQTLDSGSVVPAQLPLLIEFLCTYTTSDQLKVVMMKNTRVDSIPSFEDSVPDVCDDLRSTIDTVYLLTRCLFNQSLPPHRFLKKTLSLCGYEWTEDNFCMVVQCFRRFKHGLDMQLMSALEQRAQTEHCTMMNYVVATFSLSDDDKARFYALNIFSDREVQLRLAFIQFYNSQLVQVVHLVELNTTADSDADMLGKYISLITGYIFPSVKENFLELSIRQTTYHGKDAHPIIDLDNRRVFTDMERSDLQAHFDEDGKNATSSQCTFAQIFRQVRQLNIDVLRAPLDGRDRLLAVRYKGEQGLDWGGLYRDAMERCVEDLFSDRIDLFLPCPNASIATGNDEDKKIANPKYRESSDAIAMYSFVGNLIGMSLRTKHLLCFDLSSSVWKTIVGDQISAEDLEAVDSNFTNLLNQVKGFQESEKEEFLSLFDLTFCIQDSAGNDVELIPSGSQVPVTFEKREKFCDLALEYRLNEGRPAAEAIAAGVYALIPQRALSLFTWEQLERAVKGMPEISLDALRMHTVYSGWTEEHAVVQRFWAVMHQFSNKDRSQFLRFTWGRSRLPKNQNWSRPFKLCYGVSGDEMLPVAHTCFFQLDLPQYSTETIMRERLLVAIHFGSGEFMLR